MSGHFASNSQLNADRQHSRIVVRAAQGSIMAEHRLKQKKTKPIPATFDPDMYEEVGAATPPITVYRPGPDGALVPVETMTATEFRDRAMKTKFGKQYLKRAAEMRRKRQISGQRSRAKSLYRKKKAAILARKAGVDKASTEPVE
jgi:hypothetical protein